MTEKEGEGKAIGPLNFFKSGGIKRKLSEKVHARLCNVKNNNKKSDHHTMHNSGQLRVSPFAVQNIQVQQAFNVITTSIQC